MTILISANVETLWGRANRLASRRPHRAENPARPQTRSSFIVPGWANPLLMPYGMLPGARDPVNIEYLTLDEYWRQFHAPSRLRATHSAPLQNVMCC